MLCQSFYNKLTYSSVGEFVELFNSDLLDDIRITDD